MAGPRSSPSYYTNTEAVVLKAMTTGESDELLILLTRRLGLVRAVAKGGKKSVKRFMNCLDLFGRLQVSLEDKAGRDLARIDACSLLSRPGPALDPIRLGLAGLMAEAVIALSPEREPAPVVFDALNQTLTDLSDHPQPLEPALVFVFRLLAESGFGPNLQACLGCGQPLDDLDSPGLSLDRGGLICADCGPADRLSLGAIKTIGLCQTIDPRSLGRVRFPKSELPELFHLATRWLTHWAEREIKSLTYLGGLGLPVGGRAKRV